MNISMMHKRARTVVVVALSSLVLFAASSMAQMVVDKEMLANLYTVLKDSSSSTLVYRSPADCSLEVEAVKVRKKKAKFQVLGSDMELVVFDDAGVEYDVMPLNHKDMLRLRVTSDRLSVKRHDSDDTHLRYKHVRRRGRRSSARRGGHRHHDIHAAASSFMIRCTPVVEEEEPAPPPSPEILF